MTILMWLIPVAFADVLLLAPGAPVTEYRAYLEAHSRYSTPTKTYRQSHPARQARQQLIQAYAFAQSAFLSADREAAKDKFKSVLNLAFLEDWDLDGREILALSSLRIAQLSNDEAEREEWIKIAISFSAGDIDDSLFPPPLMERLSTLKSKEAIVQISGLGSEWTAILFNGAVCERNPCSIPGVKHKVRMTWLSDRWQPFSKTISSDRIAEVIPVRRAWVEGRCDSPMIAKETGAFSAVYPFFGLDCDRNPAPRLDLKTLSSPDPAQVFTEIPREKTILKSPWLWVGVGTAIAVILANSQRKPDREPTTTYGY